VNEVAAIHFAGQLAIFLVCGAKSLLIVLDPKGTACVSLFDRVFAYSATIASFVIMTAMLVNRP
jgi:hypothetical protein